MPAMMLCPEEARPRAIMFIKDFCIGERGTNEISVHNMLFYMYAKSDESNEVVKFMQELEDDSGHRNQIFFDPNYALDICSKKLN